MSENSISEDLVPIVRQKRKQWWRLVLLVLSPVALFWMVFGYQVYKVEAHYQLGAMNFVPRCRVALHKMLGDRFKYQPRLIDYGDWAPLATAVVRPGQVRTGSMRAWQGFHEPAQPVPSLRLAPLETRSVTPYSLGVHFNFVNHDIPPGTADPFNAGVMLPVSPTGEINIPQAGTVFLTDLALGTPEIGRVPPPTKFFDHHGGAIPKPTGHPDISRWLRNVTEVRMRFQQGTAILAVPPTLRIFDQTTHAQFTSSKSNIWDPTKSLLKSDHFCMSRPTMLRFGVEFLACVHPPVELPPKMGEIRSNEVFEIEIVHTFAGKYEISGWSSAPTYTGISVLPDTDPSILLRKQAYATFVFHTPHNLQFQVTALTDKNEELIALPERSEGGFRLHLCSFPVSLTNIVSLRVHRLVNARCFVDVGPVDPFPGSTPGAKDELEDTFPEFDLRSFHSDEMLSQALGGAERPLMNQFLNGFSETTLRNPSIRQILQHIEADSGYKGGKILIEQKQGWIWTGK